MAYASGIFEKNFIEYASYVIRDRAIPELEDGLKPVQRRILHTLMELDDGKMHKVANVVGQCMRYHPHGDASINDALVNLANDDLFIDHQGNFGNALTGDGAAAGRYIECRLLPLAKKVLYSPETTEYVDSYDGRYKEPVVFHAKIPVVVIQGASGIAVGMKTDILPHNFIEVLEAQKAALKGEVTMLYPDFPTGGIIDVSGYEDGCGFVTVRARLDISDPKKVVITELPYGVTSEQMIASIEEADRKGKLHIAKVTDYTTDKANIEIALQRNTYNNDIVDALYAYTKCENKISVNPVVIVDGLPRIMPISEMVAYHARRLVEILTRELEIERDHLTDKLHARTLERIFIEERIYKRIETKKTAEDVVKAVKSGFKGFEAELIRPVDDDDVDRLLKIPIRRISLFDIEKNRKDIEDILADRDKCDYNLAHIVEYATDFLDGIEKDLDKERWGRHSEISSFQALDAKSIAVRNLELRYDESTGYMGTNIKTGEVLMKVSPYDKVFYMKKDGSYRVVNVSEKDFIGTEGLAYWCLGDKETVSQVVFTIIYKEKESKFYFLNRFTISSFTTNKLYSVLPKGNFKLVKLVTFPSAIITAKYKPGYGYRVMEETFRFSDFAVRKTPQTSGYKLITKALAGLTLRQTKEDGSGGQGALFDEEEKNGD